MAPGFHFAYKSTVKSVAQALNTPANEPISAESSPATTIPRNPAGSRCCTNSGKAACACSWPMAPWRNKAAVNSGTLPLLANAKHTRPGMMNK